jgi:hypothetical protein
MDRLERLELLEEVRGVKARYCRFLDTKDWVSLGNLFTEDGVLDVQEDTRRPVSRGRAEIVDQIKSAVEFAATSHQVHTPEIDLKSPTEALVTWAMEDRVVWPGATCPIPGVQSITGFGQYHERYVKGPNGWQIASLKLTRFHVDLHPLGS